MTVRDYLYQHGFVIGIAVWYFYLSARLHTETDDLKAYKKGVALVSWLLIGILFTLYYQLHP